MFRTQKSRTAVVLIGAALAVSASASAAPTELIKDGHFGGDPTVWVSSPNVVLSYEDGRMCAEIAAGMTDPWGGGFGQVGLPLVKGEPYLLSFDAISESGPHPIQTALKGPAPDSVTVYWAKRGLGAASSRIDIYFVSTVDGPASLYFGVGGSAEPGRICFKNLSLQSDMRYAPNTGPRVRVNQVGYLPSGPKGATLVSEQTAPVDWQLVDSSGRKAASGKTVPRGLDPTSGLRVHEIRFDRVGREGVGFRLEADGGQSYPFDISGAPYRNLRTDALAFFYTQRSGVPILAEFAGSAYARAAGHLSVLPNQGDYGVPCQTAASSQQAYGEPWTCDYTLDVPFGWYDAGDHGKYVVGGGVSVALLMSAYERTLHAPAASHGGEALGDGTLRIPERGNGIPDILDEARFELSWMLSMQVPEGKPLAGMLHHKVHDDVWTDLPMAPADDPRPRELHRPSTAATLNFAAVAAQGARLFKRYDSSFSDRLLEASRRAYTAAKENPGLYAPDADASNGGGAYGDNDVTDEFYWAAAELYVTTHERAFRDALRSSPHHEGNVFSLDGFSWGSVAALGRMALATAHSCLSEQESVRQSVLAAADAMIELSHAQAWGQPYAPQSDGWVWGSNSQILNNLVVLGTAYDVSSDPKYRDAVLEGMGFILGRNAINRSFVTGYGTVYSQNQHSRMYAAEYDVSSPHPPPGSLAGGPNSALQDEVVSNLLVGCAPQFCYIDEMASYSTNEVAINWNSTLAWVASFIADEAGCDRRPR